MTELKVESPQNLYENDKILMKHLIATFSNGDREAVLSTFLLKTGNIWHQETGALPLSPTD